MNKKSKQTKMKCLQAPLDPERLKDQKPIILVKSPTKKESDALIKRARFNQGVRATLECDDRAEERMDEFNE